MFDSPRHMTPMMPPVSPLSDLALDVMQRSAALGGMLHPISQGNLVKFLRLTNSYYSNLIEGHQTHPADIERAMAGEYDADPVQRNLQIEGRIYTEIQDALWQDLSRGDYPVTAPDYLCRIHRRFYDKLPEPMRRVSHPGTGEVRIVVPGKLRDAEVIVGRHVPPRALSLETLLAHFESAYALETHSGVARLVAAAAAHHRFTWIHPFFDGNGRVARLFTDMYLKLGGLKGYGLWSISRGFARNRDRYMAMLTRADAERQGDHDGRGNLSERGLADFCRFFMETCSDQIDFMAGLLDLDHLLERIADDIFLRSRKRINGQRPVRYESFYLLREALLRGSFPRGEASRITGLAERTARMVLRRLTDERLLVSDTPKGHVRMGFPAAAACRWFDMP